MFNSEKELQEAFTILSTVLDMSPYVINKCKILNNQIILTADSYFEPSFLLHRMAKYRIIEMEFTEKYSHGGEVDYLIITDCNMDVLRKLIPFLGLATSENLDTILAKEQVNYKTTSFGASKYIPFNWKTQCELLDPDKYPQPKIMFKSTLAEKNLVSPDVSLEEKEDSSSEVVVLRRSQRLIERKKSNLSANSLFFKALVQDEDVEAPHLSKRQCK